MRFAGLIPRPQTISDIVKQNLGFQNSIEKRNYATRLFMDALLLKQDGNLLAMQQQEFDVEIKLI